MRWFWITLARLLRRRGDATALPGMPRCNAINTRFLWMACQRVSGHSDDHQWTFRWAGDADGDATPTARKM